MISQRHEAPLIVYDPAPAASRHSSSRRAELYNAPEFRLDWDNNIPFHVAQNVVYLRRYRGMSQQKVAAAMGTSQSAVARIESAQENITLDTLQRMIGALKGRFHVSIHPQELRYEHGRPWWDFLSSGESSSSEWTLKRAMGRQNHGVDDVLMWFQRRGGIEQGETLPARLLEETRRLAGGK